MAKTKAKKAASAKSSTKKVAAKSTSSAAFTQARALDLSTVKPPSIPVDRLLGEARALAKVASAQATALAKVGVGKSVVASLTPRIDALADAQTSLVMSRGKSRTKEEIAFEKEATELRSDMVADGRFALRDNPDAQSALDAIQEGDGLDDLVQDLKDLGGFFTKYASALGKVASDHAKKKARATVLAKSLESLVTDRRASDAQGTVEKDLRDRCATLLEETMSEVRSAGVYAFRKNPETQVKFRSSYTARKRQKKTTAPTAPTAAASTNNSPSAAS
jgi:hypothetical protein